MGPAVGAIAATLGQPLMPWQQQVADVGLELLPDGTPAYRAVRFTVPRQSGKTTLVLSWEVQRALGWADILGKPQRIVYSAQTGKDAREKILEDQVPLMEPHKRVLGLSKVSRSVGAESVVWKNGSRLTLLASAAASGHGKTIDLGVKDELFADIDAHRDQALNPAMATRPHAQSLTASTMGTAESVALNDEVAAGRAAVEADRDTGIAYFEWSADIDDDPESPEVWARCMPALGHTISLAVVEYAFTELKLDEFRRAYLNIPTAISNLVFPLSAWSAVNSAGFESSGDVFAFDVNPERSAAGIVAVGEGPTVEVVDYRPGTGWLVGRVAELHRKYGKPFVVDRKGPAGAFIEDLAREEVALVEVDSGDVVYAAEKFYDSVIEGSVKIRENHDLNAAVAGAAKRPVGDAWAWGRKTSANDISLLVAASLGLWVYMQPSPDPFVMFA